MQVCSFPYPTFLGFGASSSFGDASEREFDVQDCEAICFYHLSKVCNKKKKNGDSMASHLTGQHVTDLVLLSNAWSGEGMA